MIPIIAYWIGAGLLALLLGSKGFGFWGSGDKVIKLGVLGMKGAGKTSLHKALRNDYSPSDPTRHSGDTLKAHSIKRGDKEVIISSGLDVAGDVMAIRKLYKNEIDNNDVLFFLFKANEFASNDIYKNETLALLFFIQKHNHKRIPLIPIGTFADSLPKNGKFISKVKLKIENEINEKNEVILINLKDKNHVEKLVEKIFKA